MKIIETQCLSRLGGAGYNSPVVKVAELRVEAGTSASGRQTEEWNEKKFEWDE